jgi:hypothetical protein
MFLREHILTHAHRARCFVGSFSPVGLVRRGCYNPAKRMADWKQITARIRRARTGKDPAGQLTNLFEKTRDAMVAFELAKHFEASGQGRDALKWYAAAAERFRRADWKHKAQEAITRLGGTVPENLQPSAVSSEVGSAGVPILPAEPGLPAEDNVAAFESMMAVSSEIQSASEGTPAAPETQTGRGRRRRGRRGGRNRRRDGTQVTAVQPATAPPSHERSTARSAREASTEEAAAGRRRDLPAEPAAERPEPGLRGRFGDPGISSRLTLLEMQFRRLLTCPPVKLDQAEKAPAGPGVFVLTDDELTSYYYVEACDTLRIAIAHLTRGAAGRRGNPSLKPKLADHLGIAEARVGKYLSDHCVVRWLQLDEGAAYFAHYAIAVLRPILND